MQPDWTLAEIRKNSYRCRGRSRGKVAKTRRLGAFTPQICVQSLENKVDGANAIRILLIQFRKTP